MPDEPEKGSGQIYRRDSAEDVRRWLEHHYGGRAFEPSIPGRLAVGRALQLNQGAEEILAKQGDREIEGFVAFIDLKGYSTAVQGKSPKQIHDFVSPFLQGVTDVAVRNWSLVDKTIGDEVMLVHPNMGDVGVGPWLMFGRILGGLATLQRDLGSDYKFRVGLSYGAFYLGKVGADSFQEWTVFGECVHLAKRLHGVGGLDAVVSDRGLAVAFGMLEGNPDLPGLSGIETDPMILMLSYLKGRFFAVQKVADPPSLKGISMYRAWCPTANSMTTNASHEKPRG